MFTVKENDCVGFESIWKVKKVYNAGESQTTGYVRMERETNTATTSECETQTGDEFVHPNVAEIDMLKLSEWLTKIYPDVSRELNESVNSHVFKNYKPPPSDTVEVAAKLVQTLKVQNQQEDGDIAYRVSALSWNSTGNTLAVACNYVHKTWCHHSGGVCLFTFDRNNKLPQTPRKKLPTEACVTAVRFHLSLPAVVAAGTYSGEIIVWNTQHDEGDNIVCKINGHGEYITCMSWIADIDVAKTLLLSTSSLDGCLNLWNFNLAACTLAIKHKYKIKAPVLSKLNRLASVPDEVAKKGNRGVISFDFSPYIPDVFIVGAEGGLVIQCSLLGTVSLKGSTKEFQISDPVYKYYEGHEGEVVKVAFSPHRKEIFLSSGTDNEIRIYVMGQDEPAQVIFSERPLSSIFWIPYQDKIVTGCSSKGGIEIFNLISGRAVNLQYEDKIDSSTLTQMELNRERVSIVVVGNANGELQVWTIPWNLYNS